MTLPIIHRRCPECSTPFPVIPTKGGLPQRYCTPEHKRAWENRQLSRGQGIVTLAQAWRQGRHKRGSEAAKYAFTEFCLALDRFTAEDKLAGRPRALDVYADRMRAEGIDG